jgi:cytochrome c biogenesis protein CcdA
VANDSAGGTTVTELKELLVAYARQETVDPVKALGRYLGFGLAGSALVGLSSVFLTLGLLRLLQTETGSTFTGNLSWIPYLLALAAVLLGLLVILLAIRRAQRQNRGPVHKSEVP